MPANTTLVDYGIQTEQSDLRVHVCVTAKRIYIYPTKSGIYAIQTEKYPKRPAYTNGIVTAEGYLVPPGAIPNIVSFPIPDHILESLQFSANDTPTIKGQKATTVVHAMLRLGIFPFPINPEIITNTDLQIAGLDMLVSLRTRMQIKCDFDGGMKKHGGITGNLFIQVSECNPQGRH